jgi:Fe-S-cluster containining protein
LHFPAQNSFNFETIVFMSRYLKKFNRSVGLSRSRFRRFLTRVERNPPKGLDQLMETIDAAVWKEVDCLACSNCCRTMTPTYTYRDQQRIAAHLGFSIRQFREKWLYKNRQGEWMNRSEPCQFLDLKTNLCSIYAVRPADCAGFPHLTKKKAVEYLHVHHQNVQHCPATFLMVEKLMAALPAQPL